MNKTADILFIITLGIIIIPLLPILMPYWWIEETIKEKRNKKVELEYLPLPDGNYLDEFGNKYSVIEGIIYKKISIIDLREQKINELLNVE